jgi:hypothetical protein
MRSNPHKFLFFTATAMMCAVSFAGSMLAQAETTETLAPAFSAGPRQLSLPPGFKLETPVNEAIEGPDSTASIMPNARSCPANLAQILTPFGAHKADPARATGAALGTGMGCPSSPPDVKAPVLAAVPASQNPLTVAQGGPAVP